MKGQMSATILFWIGIVIAVTIVATVFLPQVFTTPQSSNVTTSTVYGASQNLAVTLVNRSETLATGVIPSTVRSYNGTVGVGELTGTANFTMDGGTFYLKNMVYNNTHLNVSYDYNNILPYTWDSGSSALWTIVSLAAVVLLLLMLFGAR